MLEYMLAAVYDENTLAIMFQPQSNQHATLIIEEFEPDVFRQLIEYIHTGCVTLQPRTLLGNFLLRYFGFACL